MRHPEKYRDREAWLEARRSAVGASDVPAVLNLSPYKSRYALWLEKAGLVSEEWTPSEAVTWGLRLEASILEGYAADSGRSLVSRQKKHHIYRAAKAKCLAASPDAIQRNGTDRGPGVVQVKNVGAHNRPDWSNGPPLHVQVQVQQELLCTGLEWGTIVALFGGSELRYWDVERHAGAQERIVAEGLAFWRLVETKEPPAIDSSNVTAETLARQFPRAIEGTAVELPEAADLWDRKLQQAKRIIDRAETAKRHYESQLKAALGDAETGLLPFGGRYTWKTQRREEAAREARIAEFRVLRRTKG